MCDHKRKVLKISVTSSRYADVFQKHQLLYYIDEKKFIVHHIFVEMIASMNRPMAGNANRERRVRYQHPKGAPDADLIFGSKSVKFWYYFLSYRLNALFNQNAHITSVILVCRKRHRNKR